MNTPWNGELRYLGINEELEACTKKVAQQFSDLRSEVVRWRIAAANCAGPGVRLDTPQNYACDQIIYIVALLEKIKRLEAQLTEIKLGPTL